MRAYRTSQGNWQLNFSEHGKQKTLYLGKSFTASAADRVARIVTEIIACRDCGDALPADVLRRVGALPQRVRESLERFGLVVGQYDQTLSELFQRFIKTKAHKKPKTIKHYNQWFRRLSGFFGAETKVSSIQRSDVERFADFCIDVLSPCTVFRGLGTCRIIFRYAVELGIISRNPFSQVRRGQRTNEFRQYYVERETINKVLTACENDFERLIIVLARFGGLRIPSEIRHLRYGDFTDTVIKIHQDTKTGAREVPLFREIKEVFRRLSGTPGDLIFSGNLVKEWGQWQMLACTIERVGLTRWPKFFVNCRSSCITDLSEMGYSEKTLDSIFGNSTEVRKVHYIQFQKEKEYKKVLADNAAIVEILCENGGSFEMDKKSISLREILVLRDMLVSRSGSEKNSL
jgi:hypothetical protein